MQLTKANYGAQGAAARLAEVAQLMWDRGWAEASGGNISVNVTEHYSGIRIDYRTFPIMKTARKYPALSHHHIFITAKGARMRDLKADTGGNMCLIKINHNGSGYQVLFEDPANPQVPSSELPAHIAIHNLLVERGGLEKAIVHAHVHELITLTHDPNLKNEASLNELLLKMHTETTFFIPDGIGYVPFEVPGSQAMARATFNALQGHKVVLWEKHGCLATGKDVHEAFDRIDILAKAASVYFACRKAGFEPEGLSKTQLGKIRNALPGDAEN
jgi:rhamnulose-1-phosphate aldolase